MLAKYTIEYSVPFRRHAPVSHFNTDDPVACEEFLCELLDRGLCIRAIHHEGVDLPRPDFDKLIKTAASLLAARRICASLNIKPDEERFRFGFTA
jgi:hypothetical protein